ncbi:hypothetical protein Z517_00018 [Fonsecaea pedrosoi CBS 271.37]|uniref:Uncharacterized protein n=1 Tax=Fonsecaea pedrosoi CBS 271.37 TaxID=1442368 RepID=A0A0D2H183_9EURO|nr:uncharacterized protein Z517_00018 [Fonsecaea pedrosoi CBS 271.37]KIW84630.1 hypothetical protein Z517_00018 [Fonsecaea pedrosoi CBS 271.37]
MWEKVYIQSQTVFEFAPGCGSTGLDTVSHSATTSSVVQGLADKVPGMLVNYAKAVAIIRSLEQRCVPNDYSWMIEFGAVRIMKVTHSFLDQQVTIKHLDRRRGACGPIVTVASFVAVMMVLQALSNNRSGSAKSILTRDARIAIKEAFPARGRTWKMPQTSGLCSGRSRRPRTI